MAEMLVDSVGLIGAILAGIAYLPQILHMIKEKCTYGISVGAFSMWLISAILITTHAVIRSEAAFILLGVIQLTATLIIVVYTLTHKHSVCASHAGLGDKR